LCFSRIPQVILESVWLLSRPLPLCLKNCVCVLHCGLLVSQGIFLGFARLPLLAGGLLLRLAGGLL
jgi:hypothetical protein